MSDSVSLQIAGRRFEDFLSYSVDADLYAAADSFTLELADPAAEILVGSRCELYVNGGLELTGIIDRVRASHDKGGRKLTVEGRDLMGLLVDSHCEEFVDVQGKSVKQLAEMLLGPNAATGRPAIPFISRSAIVYQENIVGKLKGKKKSVDQPITGFQDTAQKLSKIDPGMTVFEVLRTYAMSRGLMFWAEADGTLTFGRPTAGGNADYFLTCLTSAGAGNNIISGEQLRDISQRYSKIVVVSQSQGQDEDGADAGKVNTPSTKSDADFPFYKPFVTTLNNDSQSPALHARLTMEKQRHDGMSLQYTVAGHAQNGRTWRINRLALVTDEVLGISGYYLVTGRTLQRSKDAGSTTIVRLGEKGLIA